MIIKNLKLRPEYIFCALMTFTMFSCSNLTSERTIKIKPPEPLLKAQKDVPILSEYTAPASDDKENLTYMSFLDLKDNKPLNIKDVPFYEEDEEEETGTDMNVSDTYEEADADDDFSYMENQPPFEMDVSSESLLYEFYSEKFGVTLDGTENKQLLMAIDEWLNTPYRMGGCSPSGIDCSCLVKSIYEDVYGIELSRTSSSIYNEMKLIDKSDLQAGDIVCFKNRKRISHIGIYIKDNKFVHASRSKGVAIGDLDRKYYKKRFAGAGRIIHNSMQMSKFDIKSR